MKIQLLWNMALCRWIRNLRNFERLLCLHLHGPVFPTDEAIMIFRNVRHYSPKDTARPPVTPECSTTQLYEHQIS
jgi:hypothetical protein